MQETILVNPKTEVKHLLQSLKEIENDKINLLGGKLMELEELQEEIKELSKPFDEKKEKIKQQINEAVAKLQESVKTDKGMVTYKHPFVRVSYDSKALDEFIGTLDDADLKDELLAFRKETQVTTKPQIEVY